MAFEQNPYAIKITLTADSTISGTQQFRFVKIVTAADNTGTNSASVCTAITNRPVGVLQNAPVVKGSQLGEAEVTVSGVTKVQIGGTVAVGDILGINASGQAITIAPGTATTQYILGTALTAGVSGDLIAAAINCASAARAA